MFSTHYFELTELAKEQNGIGHNGISNVHLDAIEHNEEIVFMHNVKAGAASKSYGLQVARLAGLPANVLDEANARLKELESKSVQVPAPAHSQQLGLFDKPADSCLLYTSPSPRDGLLSRMPSSA